MPLLSHTKGITSTALSKITLGDLLDNTVEQYPHNDALIVVEQNIHYCYKELQAEVNTVARALIALGIHKGQRVGIWAPNCVEWTLCQFATAKIGAILVNVNPAYQSYELEYTLKQSEISCLVMADSFKKSDYCAILNALIPELKDATLGQLKAKNIPHLKTVIHLSDDHLPGMMTWQGFYQLSSAIVQSDLESIQASLDYQDPINIQYTSGTTGSPKGVTLSHFNILNNGYFVGKSMQLSGQDKLVIPVPLYHCFGMVMGNLGCVSHGAAMIYPSAAFNPTAVLQAIDKYQATALFSVPTMFISILQDPLFESYQLTSLRTGIMAGSICPAEIMKAVNQKMYIRDLQIAYGMTETSPVSIQTAAHDPFDKRVSTVGRTQPHIESKIINPETSRTLPRNTSGELCTKGYSVMLGYWNNQAATDEVIQDDGWLRTGDLATMDDEGYIQIVGRIKDMVIRGGENIYPKEVEDFLYTHPDISDVQVVGVPDEKFGEELAAWIILKPGAKTLNAQNIKTYCEGKISHFKIPCYVNIVDRYPLTVTGKVQKFKLREMALEALKNLL